MSWLVELLVEFAVDFVRSWRMAVALVLTAFVVWLIVDCGPQGAPGAVLAVVVAMAGVVIGWRWARNAEST